MYCKVGLMSQKRNGHSIRIGDGTSKSWDIYDEVINYFESKGQYVVSKELGSHGTNHHLQCVVVLKSPMQDSNFKKSIMRKFKLDKMAVHISKLGDQEYQIGYCFKEGIESKSSFPDEYLEECINHYKLRSTQTYKPAYQGSGNYKCTSLNGVFDLYLDMIRDDERMKHFSLMAMTEIALSRGYIPLSLAVKLRPKYEDLYQAYKHPENTMSSYVSLMSDEVSHMSDDCE